MKMTTINIRIDPKLKKEASRVFSQTGLTLSGAIKMYINDSVKINNPVKAISNLRKLREKIDKETE